MSRIRILPSVTTLPPAGTASNTWKEKIEEIKELGLTEASLFLTGLNPEERQECYRMLKETPIQNVPHVHLRSDMNDRELDHLADTYGVEVFNIHPVREHPLQHPWKGYFKKIYVENTKFLPSREELKEFGGLCLDFVHWENAVLVGYSNYSGLADLVRDFPAGCAHLSPLKISPEDNPDSDTDYDSHYMENLSEFDYFRKYLKYAPSIVSLEVKNSIKEQLRIKEYVENNIL